jgi:glycosyltransferase involved in cell wall biosynthesis
MMLVRHLADSVMFDGEALVSLHDAESLPVSRYVYYPPVDTERFVPDRDRRARTRAEIGIPPEAPVVGTVSSLVPMKGLEHFIAAAGLIAAERPDARFVIVGPAPSSHTAYAARLAREAADLDLPQPIVFAGEQTEVERWYPAFDVDVIASLPRSEGTTTTALEAQSCGVPVVATRVGAVGDVVEEGVTGMLVPPERPEALAESVLRILDDQALRNRLSAAGRKAALERFDAEKVSEIYVAAYESALAHAAAKE